VRRVLSELFDFVKVIDPEMILVLPMISCESDPYKQNSSFSSSNGVQTLAFSGNISFKTIHYVGYW